MSSFHDDVLNTGGTPTWGGTGSHTLKSLGGTQGVGSYYVATGSETLNDRMTVEITQKPSKANASSPGGYTQVRTEMVLKSPLTLADGTVTIQTVRMSVSTDRSESDSNRNLLRMLCAQLLIRATYDPAWDDQVA